MIPEVAIVDTWILLNLGVAIRFLPTPLWLKYQRWLIALLLYVALETLLHKPMEDLAACLLARW